MIQEAAPPLPARPQLPRTREDGHALATRCASTIDERNRGAETMSQRARCWARSGDGEFDVADRACQLKMAGRGNDDAALG